MSKSVVFDFGSEVVATALTAALRRRQLQVVRSFDLHTALAAHADCGCPHHGTALCTCQFVVLLVYGEAAQPLVLTAHSRDIWTEVQIVEDTTTTPDGDLTQQVLEALDEVPPALLTASDPAANVEADAD